VARSRLRTAGILFYVGLLPGVFFTVMIIVAFIPGLIPYRG